MTTACEEVLRHLNEAPETPLAPDLQAHVEACEVCRPRLELERTMRERLGAGVVLGASHRAALVQAIAPVPAPAARPRRTLGWTLGALAAAAAIVVAVLVARPKPREPIPPTEIFADLLGPLAQMKPPETPAAPQTQNGALPLGSVVAALWGDFEGPLAVSLDAMKAPRAVARTNHTNAKAPADVPAPGKEK